MTADVGPFGRTRAVVVHSFGDSARGIFVTRRLLSCGYAVVPARGGGIAALAEAATSFPGLPVAHLGQPHDVLALACAASGLQRRVAAVASIGGPLALLLDEADGLAVPTLVVADTLTWRTRRRVRRVLPRGSRVVRAGDFEAALLAAVGFFDERARPGLRPRSAPTGAAKRLAPAALLAAPSTLLMASPGAYAAAGCDSGVDGDTLFITCAGDGEVSLEIGVSADGDVLVNRESKVRLGDITFVKVESKASNTLMLLDEQGHKFGSGLGTLEDPFVPLQLDIKLEGGLDTLTWIATEGSDQFKMVSYDIDVTGDGLADHKADGIEQLKFDLRGGDDFLDGGDSLSKLFAAGGFGDDVLIGGLGDDQFKLSPGKDVLFGGAGWNKLDLVSDDSSIKLGDSLVSFADDGSETSYKLFQELSYVGGKSDSKIEIDGYKLSKLFLDGGGGLDEIKLTSDDSLVSIADTYLKLGDTGLDVSFKDFSSLSYLGGKLDSKVELTGIKLLKLDLELGDGLDQLKLLSDETSIKLGDGLIELGDKLNTIRYAGADELSYVGGKLDSKIEIDGYKLSKLFLDGGGGLDEIKLTSDDSLVSLADTYLKLGDSGLDTSFKQFELFSYLGGEAANKFDGSKVTGLKLVLDGGKGDDVLLGGLGEDKLRGGLGNDQVDGGGGFDTLFEVGEVDFTLTSTTLIGLGSDSFKGFESVFLVGGERDTVMDASKYKLGGVTFDGGSGDDVLIGSPYADKLIGSLGDDKLSGNQGNDSLYAGEGDDYLDGSNGTDFGDGGPGFDTSKSIEIKVNLED